mgnify:FL=1
MNNIDEQIRKALTEEDQKMLAEIDSEAGLFELIGMTFKGKQAWITSYIYFAGLAVSAAAVYFVIQYLGTGDIKSSLNWALLIITCLLTIVILKIFSWQQMQKLELLREIKRLEMRIMLVLAEQKKE